MPAGLDGVLVVHDVALDLQVRPALDLDRPAFPNRGDQGLFDHGQLLVLDTPEGLKKRIGSGDILEIRIAEGQEDELDRLQEALPDSLRNLAYQQGTLRLVGVDTPEVLPPLLDRLRSTRLQIQDMTIRKKTLEDVFIALTGRRLRE